MANSIPVVGPIDLTGNELQNARIQNLASEPTSKGAGLVYFNSATGLLGVSNGTVWKYLATSDGTIDTEQVQDIVGAMSTSGSQVTATYNDTNGTIVYTLTAGGVTNASVSSTAAISADKTADGTTNKVYTATEKTKLAGVATGATANSTDAQLRDRSTHTGTQSADTLTAGTTNGVYTLAEKTKLGGVATGATANSTDATLLARANHTGTQSADTVVDGTTNKVYTGTEKTKLAGITTGATANQTDAYLLSRANHTGTQTSSTISDFTTAVQSIVSNVVGAAPAALDTLQELAAALGNDANFATNITNQLALKANTSSLATVATTGKYSDLTGKASWSAVVGDGTATDITVTHGLGTRTVDVTVRQAVSPYSWVLCPNDAATNTTVTLHFGSAPAAGSYTVYITAV